MLYCIVLHNTIHHNTIFKALTYITERPLDPRHHGLGAPSSRGPSPPAVASAAICRRAGRRKTDTGPLVRLVPAAQGPLRQAEAVCELRQGPGRVPRHPPATAPAQEEEAARAGPHRPPPQIRVPDVPARHQLRAHRPRVEALGPRGRRCRPGASSQRPQDLPVEFDRPCVARPGLCEVSVPAGPPPYVPRGFPTITDTAD